MSQRISRDSWPDINISLRNLIQGVTSVGVHFRPSDDKLVSTSVLTKIHKLMNGEEFEFHGRRIMVDDQDAQYQLWKLVSEKTPINIVDYFPTSTAAGKFLKEFVEKLSPCEITILDNRSNEGEEKNTIPNNQSGESEFVRAFKEKWPDYCAENLMDDVSRRTWKSKAGNILATECLLHKEHPLSDFIVTKMRIEGTYNEADWNNLMQRYIFEENFVADCAAELREILRKGSETTNNNRKLVPFVASKVTPLAAESNQSCKKSDNSDESVCVVCLDKKRELALIPCGHLCLCGDCAPSIEKNCPLCNSVFTTKVKIFT